MRNLSIIILGFILGLLGCKKLTNSDGKSSSYFEKVYSNIYIRNACIIQTADLGYIVSGTQHDTPYANLFVTKLNNSGTQEWLKIFKLDTDAEGYSVIQSDDNSYFILGQKQLRTHESWNNYHIWLAKVDNNGNLIWQKKIDSTYYGCGLEIINSRVNEYLLFCKIKDSFVKSELIRIDQNGTILEKKYVNYNISKLLRISDNEFVTISDSSFLRLDSDFNIIYRKDIVTTGYKYDITKVEDGFIYVTWNNIVKIDNQGNEQWSKKVKKDGSLNLVTLRGNEIYALGSLIVEAGLENGRKDYDVYVLKLTMSGEIINEYYYGESIRNAPYDVILDNQNKLVITADDMFRLFLIKI